jgi:hypothetical protein
VEVVVELLVEVISNPGVRRWFWWWRSDYRISWWSWNYVVIGNARW